MAKITKVIKACDGHGVTIFFDQEHPLTYYSYSNKVIEDGGKIETLPDNIVYIDGTLEIFGANPEMVAKVLCLFLDKSFKFVLTDF